MVHESAFVDPTAIVCGRVVIRENVFVGPYAVIRADEVGPDGVIQPIVIAENAVIQDGVIIHSRAGAAVTVGANTSIAHRAIVHGPCRIGSRVFIGFNSVIYNCDIGDGSVVRHSAVVEGCKLPSESYVPTMERLCADTRLDEVHTVRVESAHFSEDFEGTNNKYVAGYKRIQNEL